MTDVSTRHRVLIAAAVAAVLGPRARVQEIRPVRWPERDGELKDASYVRPSFHRKIRVRVRTAPRKKNSETAHHA